MLRNKRSLAWLGAIMAVVVLAAASAQAADMFGDAPSGDPGLRLTGLLLTWQRDPTTTMTIDWHFGPVDANTVTPAPLLAYRASGDDDWKVVEGTVDRQTLESRVIHRVELTGLQPNTKYEFQMLGHDKVYHFYTMPTDLSEPIRFAVGGDTRHSQAMLEKTNRVFVRYDPHFIVWGGDLAYADNSRHSDWHEWFQGILNTLVTEDGRVIPVLNAIGNHEVNEFYWFAHSGYEPTDEWRNRIGGLFYNLLAFPGHPGYGVIDFGDYLSLIFLDTDHGVPMEGEQTEWLKQVLAEREHVRYKIPVYHVPGYPSHREFDGEVRRRVRELWVPLFEQYGVEVAFEHDDHLYKRTVPIRGNQPHPEGIVFIGDGAWGVDVRSSHDVETTWYLDRAASVRHGILVTLYEDRHHYLMVDEDGNEFDEFDPRPAVRIEAPVWSGQAPLDVAFTALATSFDFSQFNKLTLGVDDFEYGAGIASYEWDLGDGDFIPGDSQITYTFTENGIYHVRVRVQDTFGNTAVSEPLMVVVGNTAPEPMIENPPFGAIYVPGRTIVLQGAAHDEEDGILPDDALRWEVMLEGSSPALPNERLVFQASGNAVEFNIGAEDFGWNTDGSYLVRLVATDSEGLADAVEQRVRFVRLQAEAADVLASVSIRPTDDEDGEKHVVLAEQGAYIAFRDVNLTGQTMAFVRAKAPQGGLLELRLDGPDGESIAIAPVPPGDEWQAVMMPFTAPVADVHDFYVVLVLLHQGHVELNWIQLIGPGLP